MTESTIFEWLLFLSKTNRESTIKLAKTISRGLRIPLKSAVVLIFEKIQEETASRR
jgi:hypothetical protein